MENKAHSARVQLLNAMAPGTNFQKSPILSTFLIITIYIIIACSGAQRDSFCSSQNSQIFKKRTRMVTLFGTDTWP